MVDTETLRDRLVGQRFYDRDQEEAFTVVGMTKAPRLALLQYDDGVGWDEGASNFTVNDAIAEQARLEADGLDSERYRQLGAGPQVEQICDPAAHEWFPWPDEIWPDGLSGEHREEIPGNPHDFYTRIVRCKRCGLSGDVAGQFGMYGSDAGDRHATPWFCPGCGDVYADSDLVFRGDYRYCRDCADELDEETNTD